MVDREGLEMKEAGGVCFIAEDFAARQDIGAREQQQDFYAFYIPEEEGEEVRELAVVVGDGMGGYAGGMEASQAAVQGFVESFAHDFEGRSLGHALREALEAANRSVAQLIATSPERFGEAGTTLVAAAVSKKLLYWVSVGDSPLLLWRRGKLRRLNADHSMRRVFAEKVQAKEMLAADAETHPERNALLAALVGETIAEVDLQDRGFPLEGGDVLFFATDGVLTLSLREMEAVVSEKVGATAAEMAVALLEAVKGKALPRQDNTTVAVVLV